jgi:hypothetical protein
MQDIGTNRFKYFCIDNTHVREKVGRQISMFRAIRSEKAAAVPGIQLPSDAWQNYKNKYFPIVLDLDDEDDPICYGMEQIEKAKFRLEELCEHIWPTVEIVWACSEEEGCFQLLGLVASTRRNDQLIPQDGVLEKLKEILEKEGFHGNSGWFLWRNSDTSKAVCNFIPPYFVPDSQSILLQRFCTVVQRQVQMTLTSTRRHDALKEIRRSNQLNKVARPGWRKSTLDD